MDILNDNEIENKLINAQGEERHLYKMFSMNAKNKHLLEVEVLEAVNNGYDDSVLFIINKYKDLNTEPTVIFQYCKRGKLTMVQFLLLNNGQFLFKQEVYNAMFWLACESGNLDLVVYLYQKRKFAIEKNTSAIVTLLEQSNTCFNVIHFLILKSIVDFTDIKCANIIDSTLLHHVLGHHKV